MSLFYHPQIGTIIINLLSVDDLAKLYQVNTYYRNLLKSYISCYQDFFKDVLKLNDYELHKYMLLLKAVAFNNPNVCLYLLNKYKYTQKNLHSCNELLFRTACKYGNMDIINILCAKMNNKINYKANSYDAFIRSFSNGHKELSQFIFKKVDIPTKYLNIAIVSASEKGNFDIICDLDENIIRGISINIDKIFINACSYGQLDVAKSLHKNNRMSKKTFKKTFKKAWSSAAQNMQYAVLEWLSTISKI